MTVHIFSEVGGTYAKGGLIGMLSNKRPDVEFKDIKLDEAGESLSDQVFDNKKKKRLLTGTFSRTVYGIPVGLNISLAHWQICGNCDETPPHSKKFYFSTVFREIGQNCFFIQFLEKKLTK